MEFHSHDDVAGHYTRFQVAVAADPAAVLVDRMLAPALVFRCSGVLVAEGRLRTIMISSDGAPL